MNETAHHILAAERHLTELQEQQLRWAESSPEAADLWPLPVPGRFTAVSPPRSGPRKTR